MEFDHFSEREYFEQEFKSLSARGTQVVGVEFNGCVFVRCNFPEATFRACTFQDCEFRECDLSLVRVLDSQFRVTVFKDSRLPGINWTEAAWPRSRFGKPFDFIRCQLNHATFMGLDLKKIAIQECVAHDVDFSEANLSQADCRKTDFHHSRFWQTNLTEADFTGALEYSISAQLNTLKKTRFSLPEAIGLLYGLDIVLVDPDAVS